MSGTGPGALLRLFDLACVALTVNLLVVVATLPFLLVAFSRDPLASWPLLLVTAALWGPALRGAFTAFQVHADTGRVGVVGAFARGWRRDLGRSAVVGVVTACLVGVLAVDVHAVQGGPLAAVATPFFVVVGAFICHTAVLVLVADAVSGRAVVAAAVLGTRRPVVSLLSSGALVILVVLVQSRPVLGLGLALAPALHLVWAGGRHVLGAATTPPSRYRAVPAA